MIDPKEAKRLIKEKIQERDDDPLNPIEMDTDEMVELMRQACAIDKANRDKAEGLNRGVSHCINVLATHREDLLADEADPSGFDIGGMDRQEIEANYMQVAIEKIKTS